MTEPAPQPPHPLADDPAIQQQRESYLGDENDYLRRRIRELGERTEARISALADRIGQPPAVAELDAIHAGLDPEQEIRARVLEVAAGVVPLGRAVGPAETAAELIAAAGPLAGWVRDGSRP